MVPGLGFFLCMAKNLISGLLATVKLWDAAIKFMCKAVVLLLVFSGTFLVLPFMMCQE